MRDLTWLEYMRRKAHLRQEDLANLLSTNSRGKRFFKEEISYYETKNRPVPKKKRPIIVAFFVETLEDDFPMQVNYDNLQEEVEI